MKLPKKDVARLRELLPNLKEQVNALDVKISKQEGKKVELLFGKCDLSNINFTVNLLNKNSLKVSFMSAFGMCSLDFMDGASCHMLNGGRTRMGKTTFVLYLLTSLYFQNKGKIKLYICSSKDSDFYPFQNLPNVEFATDKDEMIIVLNHVKDEYENRKKLLKTPDLCECVDAKGVKKQRPDKYYLFRPIFLMIDEYADYSNEREIQNDIKMIVRKAGYLNIHVIVCTQRADARFTIPPDVKANLGSRICFTTADKSNSLNILDVEGAETLGGIPGRAILLDGDSTVIQVPHMSYRQIKRMLKPFKRSVTDDYEGQNNQSAKGSNDFGVSEKVQNLFKESTITPGIQEQQKPHKHMQQGNESTGKGWFML
jgi:DNA segregation ATPase FtsK/SpoIIIE-like protein